MYDSVLLSCFSVSFRGEWIESAAGTGQGLTSRHGAPTSQPQFLYLPLHLANYVPRVTVSNEYVYGKRVAAAYTSKRWPSIDGAM